MKTPLVTLLLLTSCSPQTPPEDVAAPITDAGVFADASAAPESSVGTPETEIFGTLISVFQDGDFSANADLSEQGVAANSVGIGAISGLRGEVTILNGETWLSYPDGEDAIRVTHGNAPEEEAAMLFVSEVSDWVEFTLDQDTSYTEFTDAMTSLLAEANWPDDGALPFTISGNILSVDWHVIDGSRLPNDRPATHEDHDEAAVSGVLELGDPTLVGFYSTQHGGIITHGGVRLHTHVIDAERQITGHVEDALIGAGSILRLPAPNTK